MCFRANILGIDSLTDRWHGRAMVGAQVAARVLAGVVPVICSAADLLRRRTRTSQLDGTKPSSSRGGVP